MGKRVASVLFLSLFLFLFTASVQETNPLLKDYESYTPPPALGVPYGMKEIPAGEFLLGNTRAKVDYLVKKRFQKTSLAKDFEAEVIGKTSQKTVLPPFYLDQQPVTNLQYEAFVKAKVWPVPQILGDELPPEDKKRINWVKGIYPKGKGEHPVVAVTYNDADTFARWLGRRLPDEKEWEKAARGSKDDRIWPWGDFFDDFEHARYIEKAGREKLKKIPNSKKNNYAASGEAGLVDTTPVGAFPKDADHWDTREYDLQDMVGNVWEWTASWARAYPGETKFIFDERFKVLRGGSWSSMKYVCRCSSRAFALPDWKVDRLGFRCARSVITGEDSIRRIIEDLRYLLPNDCSFKTERTVGIERNQVDRDAKIIKDMKVISACAQENLRNVDKTFLQNQGKKEPILLGLLHTDVKIGQPFLLPGQYFVYYQGPTEEKTKKEAPKEEKKDSGKKKKEDKKSKSKSKNGKSQESEKKKEEEKPVEEVQEKTEEKKEEGLPQTTLVPRLYFKDKQNLIVAEIKNPALYNENNVESAILIGPDKENLLFKLSIAAVFGKKRLVFLIPLKKVDGGLRGYRQ